MKKLDMLVRKIVCIQDMSRKKDQTKLFVGNLNKSYQSSQKYLYFMQKLAENDILIASYAAGQEGRHYVSKYLHVDEEKVIDNNFIICCLFLGFKDDLRKYLKSQFCKLLESSINDEPRIEVLNNMEKIVREAIEEIRSKTDEVLLLQFIRILNLVDCPIDYIDDVFLDCPIDTPDFVLEEKRFCQELYDRNRFHTLFEYLVTRDRLLSIDDILETRLDMIIERLSDNISMESLILMLAVSQNQTLEFFNDLIKKIQDGDTCEKNVCLLCVYLSACIRLQYIPPGIKELFQKLKCEPDEMLKYRKYVGHQEIKCFKTMLQFPGKLLELLHIMGENNTFSEKVAAKKTVEALPSKNRKYAQDNSEFRKKIMESQYTDEEKEYIINNTHMRVYQV